MRYGMWGRQPFNVAVVPGAMAQEGTVMTVSECCDQIDCDTTKCRSRLVTVKCGCYYTDTEKAVVESWALQRLVLSATYVKQELPMQ